MGLCPGVSVRGSLSRGVSVQYDTLLGGLSPGGSLYRWSLCPDGVSVQRGSLSGRSRREIPYTVKSVWYASYWDAFLSNNGSQFPIRTLQNTFTDTIL